MNDKYVELLELSGSRKQEYLQRYYDVSAKFYNIKDIVVTEDEIDECINKFKEKPAPEVRKQIKLKDWKFKLDEKEEGLKDGFCSRNYDESSWESVKVPYACNHIPEKPVSFGKTDYMCLISEAGEHFEIWRGDYSTWFKTRLNINAPGEEEIVYLSFDSINLKSDIWVNEFPVMLDHLGLFPFKVDITREMKKAKDKETVIAAKVSNTASTLPMLFYNGVQYAYNGKPFSEGRTEFDWVDQVWTGIAGDAVITVTGKNHIEAASISTEDIRNGDALLKCRLTLRNASWKKFNGKARLVISKWLPVEDRGSSKVLAEDVCILPMNEATACIDFKIENADLWSVDSPNLYLAHIVLEDSDGNPVDDLFETFGARLVSIKGSHFYLNNKKIVPRGTHDVCHYAGEPAICPGDRAIVKDMLLHKKMGANCSRWPSDIRMHYKKIADYCDQFGFMLSWTGYFEMWALHPEAEMYAARDVKAMVRSLGNCPSVIVWEMGDEALLGMQDFRRLRWYKKIYQLVVAEDPSRPVIPSGSYCNELVDLIYTHGEKEAHFEFEKERESVLEDFPLFNKELEVWDYHYCPCLPPIRPYKPVIDRVKGTSSGAKADYFYGIRL